MKQPYLDTLLRNELDPGERILWNSSLTWGAP